MERAALPETADTVDHPNVIAHPPGLFGGFFLAGMLAHAWRPIHVSGSPATRALGGALMLAAVVLAIGGRRALARAGTNVNPKLPATALVVTGPFRYVRNPLYTSLLLVYSGLAFAVNAAAPLFLLVVLFPLVHFGVVLREERYLERKFGAVYLRYKAVTRRWI